MADPFTGTVVVFQDRMWFGDPRLGAFVVYVDGKRAGVAPVQGQLTVAVTPGVHRVRVRQWWYRSPLVEVAVAEREVVRLRADIPRSTAFPARMARFTFTPSKCFVLSPADHVQDDRRNNGGDHS
jgi:hypothetical protein